VREDGWVSVIARIEAWPVNVPLAATYLMAPGSYPGMSRTVVRVTTGDGLVGLGETPSATDAVLLAGEGGTALVGRETGLVRRDFQSWFFPSSTLEAIANMNTSSTA